jgi:hypothetical protein
MKSPKTTVVAVSDPVHLDLRAPTVADGPMRWRMATDSVTLDVNPPCAYLLWCRDFSATSVIASLDGHPAGFVTAYRRPEQPATVMVWQMAVEAARRGAGTAGADARPPGATAARDRRRHGPLPNPDLRQRPH